MSGFLYHDSGQPGYRFLGATVPDATMSLERLTSQHNPSMDQGIRFVLGILGRGADRVSETQSILFDKAKWTITQAKKWLRDNGFSTPAVDKGGTRARYYRFRQQDPDQYSSMRTITPGRHHNPAGSISDWGQNNFEAKWNPADPRREVVDEQWNIYVAPSKTHPGKWDVWVGGIRRYVRATKKGAIGAAKRIAGSSARNPTRGPDRENPARSRAHVGSHVRIMPGWAGEGKTGVVESIKTVRPHSGGLPELQYRISMDDAELVRRLPRTALNVIRRHRNPDSYPDSESDAATLYETFHGKPSEEVLEVPETEEYHEWLSALGTLQEIKLITASGYSATISFSGDDVILSSSEDGRQLYFVGGNQSLDLKSLHLGGSEWAKDLMELGPVKELTYQTEKKLDSFRTINYYHGLGEETGVMPVLIYDTLNDQLKLAGGQYRVKPEGIVN